MSAVCVFCASSRVLEPRWLELARQVGVGLAERGHTLVSGGGRVGMMGTVAAGARSAGAYTLGVMTHALVALEIADTDSDHLVTAADLAERKTIMVDKSDAFLILPGGLGTLDELFEVWTTANLELHRKPLVLLNVDGFYDGLLDWLASLVPLGFVSAAALERVRVAGSVAAALDAIG